MRVGVCGCVGALRLCTCVHCSWFCLFAYCIYSCRGEKKSARVHGIQLGCYDTPVTLSQRATTITHHPLYCMLIPRNNTPSSQQQQQQKTENR